MAIKYYLGRPPQRIIHWILQHNSDIIEPDENDTPITPPEIPPENVTLPDFIDCLYAEDIECETILIQN